MCVDNKKVNRNIHSEIEKASIYSISGKLIFSQTKELLKVIKVITDFKHANIRRLSDKDSNQ